MLGEDYSQRNLNLWTFVFCLVQKVPQTNIRDDILPLFTGCRITVMRYSNNDMGSLNRIGTSLLWAL